MARNVFISFRFSDGVRYKEELEKLFDQSEDIIDCSENQNRSNMSDETIRKYLYGKLSRSSITIALITPDAIEYRTDICGQINDWLYDEVRYSLENRDGNSTNGLIAVYVSEAKKQLMVEKQHICEVCRKQSTVQSLIFHKNLIYANMNNIKPQYKINQCYGVFDGDLDSYCSLISFDEFKADMGKYIDLATKKRNELYKYKLIKRLEQ